MGENLWLRAKTKANLKPELKWKLAVKWRLPMKTTYFKSSLESLQKSLSFQEIYVKYLEENSI